MEIENTHKWYINTKQENNAFFIYRMQFDFNQIYLPKINLTKKPHREIRLIGLLRKIFRTRTKSSSRSCLFSWSSYQGFETIMIEDCVFLLHIKIVASSTQESSWKMTSSHKMTYVSNRLWSEEQRLRNEERRFKHWLEWGRNDDKGLKHWFWFQNESIPKEIRWGKILCPRSTLIPIQNLIMT